MPSTLTVVTPYTNPVLFTTLEAVKAELRIEGNDDDSWLTRQIAAQSRRIQSECERVFQQETVTETWRADLGVPQTDLTPSWNRLGGMRRPQLRLARTPVASIASIVLTYPSTETETLTATQYVLDAAKGWITRLDTLGRPMSWAGCQIAVTYTGGFALPGDQSPTFPEDLEDACIQMVTSRWSARGRDPRLKSEEVDGVGAQTFWVPDADAPALPTEIQDTLDRYRRLSVA